MEISVRNRFGYLMVGEDAYLMVRRMHICNCVGHLPVVAINSLVAFQRLSIFAVNGTDESFETISHERYMTAPFQVARQVTQSDTESGEHHHWNGDCWRQKSAILQIRKTICLMLRKSAIRLQSNTHHYIEPRANHQTDTLSNNRDNNTYREEHKKSEHFERLAGYGVN